MELVEQEAVSKRWLNWILGSVLLGLLNTFAAATYGALGASRDYVVVDGFILRLFGRHRRLDLPIEKGALAAGRAR